MNTATAKAEIVNQPVARLTIELPVKHAAELGAYCATWTGRISLGRSLSTTHSWRQISGEKPCSRTASTARTSSSRGSRAKRMADEERVVLGRP